MTRSWRWMMLGVVQAGLNNKVQTKFISYSISISTSASTPSTDHPQTSLDSVIINRQYNLKLAVKEAFINIGLNMKKFASFSTTLLRIHKCVVRIRFDSETCVLMNFRFPIIHNQVVLVQSFTISIFLAYKLQLHK